MGFPGRLAALPSLLGAAVGRGGGGAWRRPGRPCLGTPLPGWVAAARRPPLGGRAASSRALGEYEKVFRSSVEEPEKLWGAAAEQIEWYKPWVRALERGHPGNGSWFVGGELNICYNAVDRHVENGRGDQIAIIYDSPVTNAKEKITYKQLLEQVSRLAAVMVRHGVKKGDRVVLYMPMIPQTVYCMLACARIGAIHSLIFGGFASKELSVRIEHAKPKLVVTASFGVEPKRKVEYVSLLEGALARVQNKPAKVLIYKRPNLGHVPLVPGRDLDWEEELAKAECYKCVSVPSDHPLYILYTSGTTGLPKGVVRPTGGYAVMLNWTMSAVYGLKPGEVWWAASDLGWVVGHSYICYGPLLHGNTTVLYENLVLQLLLPVLVWEALQHLHLDRQESQYQDTMGYYDTMDAGYMDEDGYLYVLSRADDVINVAGHRISSGAIEECVLFHHAVADCAVVGQEDALKGHVPFALCVLREGIKTDEKKIFEEIVEQVRANIGPVAAFQKGMFVKQLPKTRSGKVPRSALSALVSGKPYKDTLYYHMLLSVLPFQITPTIEDASVFKHIEEVLQKHKMG
ncbi:acyl-CoA synthetase short-chain family member 3, mitochondrial isoform X5 [Pogoniulus pusillus]|uniref:acyl-CoA synthetase short-chain family member 3, mitochondrial isoform X5 n=1 Tax=Pogoniulus pusillus TaxID=488313 RepID=UPI0030B93A0C